MNVLAFDSCLGAVSVAVRWRDADGQSLMRHAREVRDRGHAERLMPMIAEVMQEAGLPFADIGRIAVTVGPGTFTGVRGGVAAARGLALASGVTAVGVTSLAVMAHRAKEQLGPALGERLLAVAIDARRDFIYLQLYEGPENAEVTPPLLLGGGEAAYSFAGRSAIIVGSGAELVARAVGAAGGQAEAMLVDLQPDARALAAIAANLVPDPPLRPLYLRPPDVKPQADRSLPRAATMANP
jgi:tRNA threonylcarbamoyl adenosine modification protein YeaZ